MIRFSTQEAPLPHSAHIPYRRARRWWSDVEENHRPPPVSVFVTQKAYVRICAHAGSDLENEVGGWLVGKRRTDHHTGEDFIVVEAVLPALHTRQGSAFLTFTQDSQVAMYELMEDRYPGKELVGWYHTHPKMGVFLSNYDVWLHKHFFIKPWQVALVVEPHSNVAGFFAWDTEGQLDSRYYYGFHEINNGLDRSVVHWRNMSAKPLSDVEGG
jgi:proteasome lid subunit RPN8/RPN11